MPYTGRCLCGEVRYELDAELGPLVNCHCQYCRRAHGSAFSTVTMVRKAALRFESGAELVTRFGGRHFCRRCATRLYNGADAMPGYVALVVASLDQEPSSAPVAHLNLESKAAWYEIHDQGARFEGFPPGIADAEEGD
jgi:hypothetical protein